MLEKDYFNLLIAKQEQIAESVYETIEKLRLQGYGVTVEAERNDANLFYHLEDGDRILLKREHGKWA